MLYQLPAVITGVFLGNLFFSGKDWLFPAFVWLVVALLLIFLSYRFLDIGGKLKWLCASLKILGFGLLLLCLLEPLWSSEQVKPGANHFPILADNSQGMQIGDPDADESRGEQMLGWLLDADQRWREELENQFQVRRYMFDSRLHGIKDFGALRFDGRTSGLNGALQSLRERFEGQPLAGVLLFSDGNATDVVEGEIDLIGMPPIYPVVIGSDQQVRDISIQSIGVSETAFEDAPITVKAEVQVTGFSGWQVVARLVPVRRESDNFEEKAAELDPALEEQSQEAETDRESMIFRFQFRPEASGISFYRFQVGLAEVDLAATDVEAEDNFEGTIVNNQRIVVVDRGGGPYRILYVAGRPNWEYKFLKRALEEDDQVQLVGLIRIAKRAPRFEFKGRRDEVENPLYRGFDKKDELTEQYDQPVMTRLNVRNEKELVGGFPKKAEDLFEYAAIIIDDLEAGFFTMDQMSLMQEYVSERGGGLLVLGGVDSLVDGEYEGTPVGAMLPVYLDRDNPEDEQLSEVRAALTREGMLEPWMRLRSTESQEQERLAQMTSFGVLSRVGGPKPGATVLMDARDEMSGDDHPGLVVQRYGKGKTAALMIGDLWLWHMRDESESGDQPKAWRQLIRWLIGDVPEPIEMTVRRVPTDPNQAVAIGVRVRDQKFWPMENAGIELSVETIALEGEEREDNETSAPVKLKAEASAVEPGLYEAVYIPRHTGGYAARADIQDADGLTVGQAEVGWTSDSAAEEFMSLYPNRLLMEQIARETGGQVVEAEELAAFVGGLSTIESPITEQMTSPLWNTSWMFMLALGCFLAEWGVRRSRGLA